MGWRRVSRWRRSGGGIGCPAHDQPWEVARTWRCVGWSGGKAQQAAQLRARRPKRARSWPCARGCARWWRASRGLRWSPQQIAAWLALAYPDDPEMRVSHETIYLSLFVQARGALRKELFRCLRTGRARRRPRGLTVHNGQGKIRGRVSIAERPAEAADRAVPGHWEGDIIFGARRSTIATLAGRRSRFVMLVAPAPRARRRVGHRRAQPRPSPRCLPSCAGP